MKYRQLTTGERYALSALRRQGLSQAAIARAMGRHPSTIGRELKRNAIMAHLTQKDCTWIADHLNNRPRKRLDFLTAAQCYEKNTSF